LTRTAAWVSIADMSEPSVSDLLTVAQAIAIIDATAVTPRVVELPLQEALGHRLAEDLLADRPYPPFDKSLMDGYAVRCADLHTGSAELRVIGEIAAGQSSARTLAAGEAMAVMTGAPLPPGADCVVPVEETKAVGSNVRIATTSKPGRYIAAAGSDAPRGQIVLRAGLKMEAAQVAAAASVGAASVKVFAPPRVAIFATGDEIVPFDAAPGPAQIRDSNSIMLAALLRRMGCRVIDLGVIPDSPDEIRRALLKAIQVDAAVITGGMSMGRYDFVPAILKELGAEPKISKLRIKPGKPFIFTSVDRATVASKGIEGDPAIFGPPEGTCHVFGLPGNPVSGFVCMTRLASRLLARLAGGAPQEKWLLGKLATALDANGPREFYQPVLLDHSQTGLIVRPLPWKGSADLFTLAAAHALLMRPENQPALPAGAEVRVIEL